MSANQKILDGIKQSMLENRSVTIDLREASTLTGSGDGKGGRTQFDEAFDQLRYANPFRMGARNIKALNNSAVQFVAKSGNATNQSTGGWGSVVSVNTGTPNTATSIWQLPNRILSAQLPIRTAALDDINGLQATVVADLIAEFGEQEGLSMARNNDQSGTTTTTTGGTDGLRGLNSYTGGGSAAYGTSGTAITDGRHTVKQVTWAATYNLITDMADALPAQYWGLPSTAWHMTPAVIKALRQVKDSAGLPIFLGLDSPPTQGTVGTILGWPVIPNPYLSDSFPAYLANWDKFLTIADVEEMTVQTFDQTQPGTITLYAERRVVSSVRDPFAGVRAAAA